MMAIIIECQTLNETLGDNLMRQVMYPAQSGQSTLRGAHVTNKIKIILLSACICVAANLTADARSFPQAAPKSTIVAHTPPTGSQERKEVMDGLRGDQKVVFKVHYLKIHGDWAFVDVTPLDDKGKPVAEGGASLMHKENGTWKVQDLSKLPDDPDNPMGIDDPNLKFVKAVQKLFPGVPSDIFPPRARSKMSVHKNV
jgi:hypothetical protein